MHQVSVYDLEFQTRHVRCASSIGLPVHHVVSFGMPKLNPRMLDTVFYLYREEPTATGNKITGPWGTGCLVGRPMEGGRANHIYGVTNRHVVQKTGASIIRINTTDGKTRDLDYQPHDWQFLPQQDDLIAIDISDDHRDGDQMTIFGENEFISESVLEIFEIGPGDDVFMMGLFSEAHGGERNVPVVRFGNIAMLANNHALIEEDPDLPKRPCHLTDMRSKAGFSGSPVLVYRNPSDDLDRSSNDPLPLKPRPKFMGLLGIHCGQFWERTKVFKGPPISNERLGDPIHEGDELYIQGAMNIVIPAWRITEILNLEIFELARKKREPDLRRDAMKRAQQETVESSPPATVENPKHREDFNSLLGEVAKKRAQEG